MINKTTCYLIPLLEFTVSDFELIKKYGFKGLYLGDGFNPCQGELYLLIDNSNNDSSFIIADNILKKNKLFKRVYETECGKLMYIYQLVGIDKMYVYNAFIRSKYSKLKEYIKKYQFKERFADGSINDLWWITYQPEKYKKMIESQFNVNIENSWELGERIKEKEEIFNYKEKLEYAI